jgi:hypothetical protein
MEDLRHRSSGLGERVFRADKKLFELTLFSRRGAGPHFVKDFT